jgi:hypothetical protein
MIACIMRESNRLVVSVSRENIKPSASADGFSVFKECDMNIWLVLAVVVWFIGAIEPIFWGGPGRVNWLCAGLCLAGIGLWLA